MPMNASYDGPGDLAAVIPVFPLPGALLLPRGQMPLNIFEPRPWHEAFPQRPRVWTLEQLTTWGTRFDFDLKSA